MQGSQPTCLLRVGAGGGALISRHGCALSRQHAQQLEDNVTQLKVQQFHLETKPAVMSH